MLYHYSLLFCGLFVKKVYIILIDNTVNRNHFKPKPVAKENNMQIEQTHVTKQ